MKTINLVMIVKNEERCLERCLNSVRHLVDGIIIVDTGSTDQSKQIARNAGTLLYDYAWKDDFSAARNFALAKSTSDWNLILDADEYLAQGDKTALQKFLEDKNALGAVQIRNAYLDNGEMSHGIDYATRIIPKGVKYIGKIHEQVDSSLPRIPLPLIFEHDGYLLPNKSERNLPILMEELKENPKDSYVLYQIASTLANMGRHAEAVNYFEQFYTKSDCGINFIRSQIAESITTEKESCGLSIV